MGGLNSTRDSQASKVLNKFDNLLDYLSFYLCPLAIRMGMSFEQFWYDDPEILWVYLEAYEQEQKARLEYDNNIAFLQGQYIMSAIAQCLQFSKKPKRIYPKKPFNLNKDNTPDIVKQQEFDEMRKSEMKLRCQMFNKNRRK